MDTDEELQAQNKFSKTAVGISILLGEKMVKSRFCCLLFLSTAQNDVAVTLETFLTFCVSKN